MMSKRIYRVLVTSGRTFQTFDTKEKAVECAKNCFALGFDDVSVSYGNWKAVPKTPCYQQTGERKFDPCWILLIEENTFPAKTVQRFKADTVKAISDVNKIDNVFYREFWYKGIMTGRYSSKDFCFDFGKDLTEEEK